MSTTIMPRIDATSPFAGFPLRQPQESAVPDEHAVLAALEQLGGKASAGDLAESLGCKLDRRLVALLSSMCYWHVLRPVLGGYCFGVHAFRFSIS